VEFLVVQFLTGLAGASALFLVASGLSIIFGVTRIVNFAHGAFYMLGAYIAYSLTERWSGALGLLGRARGRRPGGRGNRRCCRDRAACDASTGRRSSSSFSRPSASRSWSRTYRS
jgi:ABC-type branched-subunit amino acid transport system permease subunit